MSLRDCRGNGCLEAFRLEAGCEGCEGRSVEADGRSQEKKVRHRRPRLDIRLVRAEGLKSSPLALV